MVANMEKKKKCSRKNTTKRWRDSQSIGYTVQNTGYQDTHRIGWICSKNRWKNEAYAKRYTSSYCYWISHFSWIWHKLMYY